MKFNVLNIHDYDFLDSGGIQVNTKKTSEELAKFGLAVGIISSKNETRTNNATLNGVTSVYVEDTQISEFIRNSEIIHIHINMSLRDFTLNAIRETCISNKPLILSIHTDLEYLNFGRLRNDLEIGSTRLKEIVELVKSNQHSRVVVYSDKSLIDFVKFGFPRERMRKCNLGLDLSKTKNLLRDENYLISFAGFIDLHKGVDTFVESFRLLKKHEEFKESKAIICGSGPYLELLKKQEDFRRSGIEFTDQLTNEALLKKIAASRYYVHLSRSELYSLAVLEAMSLGIPVIVSDAGGLPENVDFGRCGIVVEKDSPEKVVEAIMLLEKNPNLKQMIIKNAKEKVYVNHSIESQVYQYLKIYSEVIKNGKKECPLFYCTS